jgi:coenzyme F420-0:L-glutamate ligase/coenzyme F420-1:gamma-L-glutamate ligase
MPLVKRGDNIADLIDKSAKAEGVPIENHDVLIVAQKIVSKAEGGVVDLRTVKPSPQAIKIAKSSGKDPRHVETILRQTVKPSPKAEEVAKTSGKDPRHIETILNQTSKILRLTGPHVIVETRHGFVCANAGVDRSNVENADSVVVLPVDPDKSASQIRAGIRELTGADVGVIVSDTFGRAWRVGQVNVAIGVAGLQPIIDYRGSKDMFGYILNVTQMAVADELASAAELVMKKSEGVPVAIIKGVDYIRGTGTGRNLIRPEVEDLFR